MVMDRVTHDFSPTPFLAVRKLGTCKLLHCVFYNSIKFATKNKVYFWGTDHNTYRKMAEGVGVRKSKRSTFGSKGAEGRTPLCAFSLLSLSFVPWHQDTQ